MSTVFGCFFQAIRALREILEMDTCKVAVKKRFPHLFLAVLFQVSFSTRHMPEDVQALWSKCTREDKQPHEYNRCSIAVFPSLPQPPRARAPIMTRALFLHADLQRTHWPNCSPI